MPAKGHFIIFNCSKVIESLCYHIVISDIHGMFAELQRHHVCVVTHKYCHLNYMINNSSVLEVSIASFHTCN